MQLNKNNFTGVSKNPVVVAYYTACSTIICRKASTDWAEMTSGGRVFHVLTVRGKNDCLWYSFLESIAVGSLGYEHVLLPSVLA